MILLPGVRFAVWHTLKREWVAGFRNSGDFANPLIFFICTMVFIPLGVSPDSDKLAELAPGMVWIIALLATLLALDRLFSGDFENGSLEQMILSGQPMHFLILTKIFVHWLITGLPLTLLSPIFAGMMFLPDQGYLSLFFSLLLGTFALSLVGAIGAALTVALRRGGLLLSLIVMPLYVPVLILGTGIVNSAIDGLPYSGFLSLLCAYVIFWIMLAPFAAAGALRVSLDG